MALLNLRAFDDEIYRWLKVEAANRGYTLKELVTRILREVKRCEDHNQERKSNAS